MRSDEPTEGVTLAGLGDLAHVGAGMIHLEHRFEVDGSVVETVPVQVMDNLAGLYWIAGMGQVPCEMGPVNVATAIDGRPVPPFFGKPDHVVALTPAPPGVVAAPEVGVIWAAVALACPDFEGDIAAPVAAGHRTVFGGLVGCVDTGEGSPAVGAVCGGFHATQHSMEKG